MPIPKPRKSEKKDDFISRCMSNSDMKSEFSDRKKRLAVCNTTWKNKDKKKGKSVMKMKDKAAALSAEMESRTLFYTKPGGEDEHTHMAILNEDGDGVTTLNGDEPHVHMIENQEVMEAKPKNHTHQLELTRPFFSSHKSIKYSFC